MKTLFKIFTAGAVLSLTLAAQGCAHSGTHNSVDQELDQKLASETHVTTRAGLSAESAQLIRTAPGLTDEQRAKLTMLRKTTHKHADQLARKSRKLQSLLVKEMLSPQYRSDEIVLIKSKIKETEHERLGLFFQSVAAANTILDRWPSEHEKNDADFDRESMVEMIDTYPL